MKSVSDVLHKTPWWALLFAGLAISLGLAAFIIPYHILDYRRDAATPQERQQIKREIDNAFADNAIDLARGVLLSMRGATSDANRREELNEALRGLEEARQELREAGRAAARTKREAAREARQAVKDADRAIAQIRKESARALKNPGPGQDELRKSFDAALAAAIQAKEEAVAAARTAAEEAGREADRQVAEAAQEAARRAHEVAGSIAAPPAGSAEPVPGGAPPPEPAAPATVASPPPPPLPPELRTQIRQDVTRDLYRIGVGAGLVLIFIPIFILLIVAKFFIDRSRAAQRLAELKRKEAEFHRMTQQVTEAKLSALQAQVEPHFLYNTLASVQALTEVDPARANEMTGHLIQYLRNALPKMRESVSTVGQEVELVRAYLNILQMRMGKRLAFEIAVPAELMERPFPPLMLPSLVENAIKHGLEPQREGGMVRIAALEEGETLRVIVADTGRGIGESAAGGGVGLANIRERLAAMYGDEAKLTLEAQEPRGVVATIAVPRRGARPAEAGASHARTGPASGAAPAQPATRTQRTLRAMGTAERAWRKGLTFAFVVLVVITAIVAGLAIFGITVGVVPVQVGDEAMVGGPAKLLGTAGIALAFAVVVIVLAILLAVVYGMGFLMVGLLIFIPVVVVVSMLPALAPFILVGLGVWWFMRRRRLRKEAAAPVSDQAPLTARETPPVAGAQ